MRHRLSRCNPVKVRSLRKALTYRCLRFLQEGTVSRHKHTGKYQVKTLVKGKTWVQGKTRVKGKTQVKEKT